MDSNKDIIQHLLSSAGVTLNGDNPWDVHVTNPRFYDYVLKKPDLYLGETYMLEWWNCDRLDVFFLRILRANIDRNIKQSWFMLCRLLMRKYLNLQTKRRSQIVAVKHYDLGNSLYQSMLGPSMAYTCGYWKHAKNLDEAQNNKYQLICDKIQIKDGMHILDVGCGFGGFARYACEKYNVKVTGITISQKQAQFAKELCKGLCVDIKVMDYREITNQYDAIVSLGMFEHVGFKNYSRFMKIMFNSLKSDGLFILHSIGNNRTILNANLWLNKYIFPNGMLPSIQQIGHAIEPYFIMEDWHNFGADYDLTLMSWHENFINHWSTLRSEYDGRFKRMWVYYLMSCAGAFRARDIQLWQIVLSKSGVLGGYTSPR